MRDSVSPPAMRPFSPRRVVACASRQKRLPGVILAPSCFPSSTWREDYGPEWTRRGIARFRYTAKYKTWTLYWSDRNQCCHQYDLIEPSSDVEPGRKTDELTLLGTLAHEPSGATDDPTAAEGDRLGGP